MKPENVVKELNVESGSNINMLFNQMKKTLPATTLVAALSLSEPTSRARHLLCDLAGYRRIKRAVPVLLETLHVLNEHVRSAAAEALMKIGDKRTGAELFKRLQMESSVGVRQMLILSLGATKYSDGIPYLLSLLTDPCETTRGCSVWSLGELAVNGEVYTALKVMEPKETSGYVRERIQDAMVKLQRA